jgi:hypothetical protein
VDWQSIARLDEQQAKTLVIALLSPFWVLLDLVSDDVRTNPLANLRGHRSKWMVKIKRHLKFSMPLEWPERINSKQNY